MLAFGSCSIEDALMNFRGSSSGAMRRRFRFRILGDEGKRKKRIQNREKIFVLANDFLTGDPSLHELSVSQDVILYPQMGVELSSAWSTLFTENYKGALNSTLLDKSLHQKLWDVSPYLQKQLPDIEMVTAKIQAREVQASDNFD